MIQPQPSIASHRPRHTLRSYRGRIALVALLTLLALGLTPGGQAYTRSALLVGDIAAAEPWSPLRHLTPAPVEEQVIILWAGGELVADIYWPTNDNRSGGLILVPGYPVNIRDPQLTRLARGLAHLGITVLVPQLPRLHDGELSWEDVESLVQATRWLQDQPVVDGERIGLAGFCIGSSLALLAAGDQRISGEIAAVHIFGGYYDLRAYLRAIATGVDSSGEAWSPAQEPIRLFARNLVAMIERPEERRRVAQYLAQPASQIPNDLTPLGQIVYTLLTSRSEAQVDAALSALPSLQQQRLDQLSPQTVIGEVRAPVYIMHDQDDPYVPASEAVAMREALPSERVTYTEFTFFAHVRPDSATPMRLLIADYSRLVIHLAPLVQTLTSSR